MSGASQVQAGEWTTLLSYVPPGLKPEDVRSAPLITGEGHLAISEAQKRNERIACLIHWCNRGVFIPIGISGALISGFSVKQLCAQSSFVPISMVIGGLGLNLISSIYLIYKSKVEWKETSCKIEVFIGVILLLGGLAAAGYGGAMFFTHLNSDLCKHP